MGLAFLTLRATVAVVLQSPISVGVLIR